MSFTQASRSISLKDYLAKFTFEQTFRVNRFLEDEDKCLVVNKYVLKNMAKGSQIHELLENDALKLKNSKGTYIVLPVEPILTTTIDYLAGFNNKQIFKVTETCNCIDFIRKYYCKKYSIKELSESAFEAKCSRNRKKLTLHLDNHEFLFEPVSSI